MNKRFSKKLFGGLTAVFATLLTLSIGLTSLAFQWAPLVNKALGITEENIVTGGDSSVDTVYYKSRYGDISALYTGSPTAEQKAALAQAQAALVKAEKAYAVREQEEGSVLLKNGDVDGKSALPLTDTERNITIFGNNAVDSSAVASRFVYRTAAAGASPTDSKSHIYFTEAFRNAGFNVNEEVLKALAGSGVQRNRSAINGASDIGEVPASFYDPYRNSFSGYGDAAIVVFTRMAGEGMDLNTKDADGISQLALHQEEADLLRMIKSSGDFKKTIVILNSANPLETGFLFDDQYGVDACLWIGEPTMYGSEGVVNLLTGKANPSGRLVDTYASNSLSAPAVQNCGNMSFTNNMTYHYAVEAEGIYVGYKYYETRYEDSVYNRHGATSVKGSSGSGAWNYADEVVFPFGYGLSYTEFRQTLDSVVYDAESDSYIVSVTVTNTGDIPGKDVVQVYAQTPYDPADGIEKSAINFVGFNKTLGTKADGAKETLEVTDIETGLLAPDESETLTVSVDRYMLASYSVAANGGLGGYVLTRGDYYLSIGNNAHDALNNALAAKEQDGLFDENGISVPGDADKAVKLDDVGGSYDEKTYADSRYTGKPVQNKLESADINYWIKNSVEYLSRSNWEGTYPQPVSLELTDAMKKEMDAGVYKVDAATAPTKGTYVQGQSNGMDLVGMRNVPWTGTFTDEDGVEHNADELWEKFIDQLTIDDLVRATTSNAGGNATSVSAPSSQLTDGPGGIAAKMPDGEVATCYPSAVVTSSTFNPKIFSMRGDFIAEDGIFTGIDILYGPGANIHRTPFSGRNFEYYSEDANLTAICAALEVKAMNDHGLAGTLKHFAGNDQETNRTGIAMFNNEQGWREGALRGFEFAVGKSESLAIMSAYNMIGCTPTTSYRATNIDIMVDEWGFHGINITDGSNGRAYINSVDSVLNGTTMFCLDNRESDLKRANSRSDYDDVLAALRAANKQYYYTLSRTHAINGIAPGAKVSTSQVWWKGALIAIESIFGVLLGASVVMYVVFGYVLKKREVKTDV